MGQGRGSDSGGEGGGRRGHVICKDAWEDARL